MGEDEEEAYGMEGREDILLVTKNSSTYSVNKAVPRTFMGGVLFAKIWTPMDDLSEHY